MGCYVPVQVKVADTFSNGATIALDAQGGRRCSDPTNPFGPLLSSGGKTGGVILARLSALAQLEAGKPAQDLTLDIGAGLFTETKAGGDLAYNPIMSVPPVGA